MLFEKGPKFRSKFGRKMFRESTSTKPMSFSKETKVKKYLEKKLGTKKDVSAREYKIAEAKAMKRFWVGRGANSQDSRPESHKLDVHGEMLRDKIAREKMPPTLHDAAYQTPSKKQMKQVHLSKEHIPDQLSDIISHKPPVKKPPKNT